MAFRSAVVQLIAVAGLVGCQPKVKPVPKGEPDLKAAARQLATDLASQIASSSGARTLVIDPLLDRATGQQTGASAKFQEEMAPALTSAIKGLTILPFDADGAAKARFVLAGNVSTVKPPDKFAISSSLTDLPSGIVVAQSAASFAH